MVTCTSTHAHACVYHSEREAVRRYPWNLPCACRPPHAGVLRRSLGLLTPSLAVEPCALKHKATHVHVLAPASQGCMKRGSSGCPRPDSVPRLSTRASCFAQVEDRLFNGLPRGRGWRAYQPAATLKIIAARRLASPQGHSDEELWGFANDDLAALEALLGGRDFFFGAHASALDCAVFGQLIQFMDIPMSFPQQASTSNLVFRVSCCLTQLATRWPCGSKSVCGRQTLGLIGGRNTTRAAGGGEPRPAIFSSLFAAADHFMHRLTAPTRPRANFAHCQHAGSPSSSSTAPISSCLWSASALPTGPTGRQSARSSQSDPRCRQQRRQSMQSRLRASKRMHRPKQEGGAPPCFADRALRSGSYFSPQSPRGSSYQAGWWQCLLCRRSA